MWLMTIGNVLSFNDLSLTALSRLWKAAKPATAITREKILIPVKIPAALVWLGWVSVLMLAYH